MMSTGNSAWVETQKWLQEVPNTAEVLQGDRKQGEAVVQQLQISSRTLMGTIALETGGVLFDHGWLRFLGSGSERMKGNLLNWNSPENESDLQGAFIVAYDALGGFFAMNGGAFSGEKGHIFYLEPDTLQWRDLAGTYSQMFSWAAMGDLNQFYRTMRWPGWEQEVASLTGDEGMSMYPFLFTEKELPVLSRSRRSVPMRELWNLHLDLARQLKNVPKGTPFTVHVTDTPPEERM